MDVVAACPDVEWLQDLMKGKDHRTVGHLGPSVRFFYYRTAYGPEVMGLNGP